MTLVKRDTASRLIVEDRARLASDAESAAYFAEDRAKREQAEAERRFSANRVGFSSGEILEQFCQIQGDGIPQPKDKQSK